MIKSIPTTGDSQIGKEKSDGVHISTSSTNNRIGTDGDGTADEVERNVISGNGDDGVFLDHGSSGNIIAGNYIGTNDDGDAALPNTYSGVHIQACSNNRVGGTTAAEHNVISGNQSDGVRLHAGASANVVQGNYIGTDASSGDLGNAE